MLSLLPHVIVAQAPVPPPALERQIIIQPQEIRSLPGQLNNVSVFNSNSPEVVPNEGILLSTFPSDGKRFPQSHLNKPLSGRFDIFSHHIARPTDRQRTLYQGILLYNPSSRFVSVRVLQAVSHLTTPDAPFVDLPPKIEDPLGQFFSGPGSRVVGEILRGKNDNQFPSQIVIPPQQARMLVSLPIPASNARSTLIRVESNGPVYLANLAKFAVPQVPEVAAKTDGKEAIPSLLAFRQPTLSEWQQLLFLSRLVEPRDLPPTPLDDPRVEKTIYGRVSGISLGSEWIATLTDKPEGNFLSIPARGKAFSYPLSTVNRGTQGTGQVQSAPMLVRYPDTAFLAHGNYGVHYNLTLPLRNTTKDRQTVVVSLQTPFKQDRYGDRLFFAENPQGQIFFRGPVRVTYSDDLGQTQVRYFHLVQRQGQQGDPLVNLNMRAGEFRQVNLDFLYPPDATPPQVITVRTTDLFYGSFR